MPANQENPWKTELFPSTTESPPILEVEGFRPLESSLENSRGEHSQMNVAIMSDGKARMVNFWDIDKTLLMATDPHGQTVELMFPEVENTENLRKVYFAGFRLGNSFREWDRMYRIFTLGEKQYENPEVYKKEFIDDEANRKRVDEAGSDEHDRANGILQQFGRAAARWMKNKFEEDPGYFQDAKFLIGPMTQLLKAKASLGQVNVYMTANQQDFARALVKYSGLADYGLALATDETMVGGGKEVAIPKLIQFLHDRYGLEIDDKRLTVIGDSISGDIGSGNKVQSQDPLKQFAGVLVLNGPEEVETLLRKIVENGDPELVKILRSMNITPIDTSQVPQRAKSTTVPYRLGKRTLRPKKPKVQS